MNEYQSLEHLTPLTTSEQDNFLTPSFYLSHNGIFKIDGDSKKIRVVFNGSCRTSNGLSLNDVLLTGANLLIDIFEVLLYFRRYRSVFLTDITKMFRQIFIHPDDKKFQRILWIDHKGHISTSELTTVTYGTRADPFLANRVMKQLIVDEGSRFPLSIEPMTKGRYVDDISGRADKLDELIPIAQQLNDLCNAGGFPLAKWKSNLPSLLSSLPQFQSSNSKHSFDHDNVKVLGLNWLPSFN